MQCFQKYRKKLKALVSKRPNSHLHIFDQDEKINHLIWLNKYINSKSKYIITTKLDNDDAIYTGYTKNIRVHLNELLLNELLPPVYLLGCYDVVLWDFFCSANAKLGYRKPRPKIEFPVSAGFTVCCKFPEMDFSILHFGHHNFHLLAEDSVHFIDLTQTEQEQILNLRNSIKQSGSNANLSWDGVLLEKTNFHVFKTDFPQALLMNHYQIVQYNRLINTSHKRVEVEKGSFSNIAINYKLAAEYIKKFRISFSTVIEILNAALKLNPNQRKQLGFFVRIKAKFVFMVQVLKAIKKLA